MTDDPDDVELRERLHVANNAIKLLIADLAAVHRNREAAERELGTLRSDLETHVQLIEALDIARAKVAALRGHIECALGQFSRNQGKCCLGGSCTRDQGRDDECALHNVVATLRAAISAAPAEPQPDERRPDAP